MYDRKDDLPPDYPYEKAMDEILSLEYQEYWPYIFERANFLNQIGSRAIDGFFSWIAGEDEGHCGSIGAAIYSVATSPSLTGASLNSEPTYHDPVGAAVAGNVVSTLVMFEDKYDAMGRVLGSVGAMSEDAPNLSGLVEKSAAKLLAEPSKMNVYKVKSGAAVMRSLHIDAQLELFEENDRKKIA